MRRSEKVTAVYHELRQSVGAGATASEVLECAASLVDLFLDAEDGARYELRTEQPTFDMLAVDVALADGGWRILSRDWHRLGWESSDNCGGIRHREWLLP